MNNKDATDPNSGALLCLLDGVGIHDPTGEHVLTIAPTGSGKTTASVIGNIIHLARLGYSQMVNDCKPEIAYIVKDALEKELGCRVKINNIFDAPDLPHHDCNPLQILMDDYADPIARKNMLHDASNIARQLIPEPTPSDKNKWVRDGGRTVLLAVLCGLAVLTPKSCTLAQALRIITSTAELVRFLKALATQTDLLNGDLAGKATGLLDTYKDTEEHFAYFKNAALDSVSSFYSSGHLGSVGENNDYSFEDLRDETQPPLIIINVCPLAYMDVAKDYFGLMFYTAFQTLKRQPKGRKVAMIMDEFTNFKVDLSTSLTALRSFGVRCFLYAQSENEIATAYGDKMLITLKTQCRTKIYFGVKDNVVAKELQDALGSSTKINESHSFSHDGFGFGDGSSTINTTGRPLLYLDEIIALPSNKMIVLIDNKYFLGDKVAYAEVAPWRDWVGSNPIEGGKLTGECRLTMHYSNNDTATSQPSGLARFLPFRDK